MRFYDGRLLRVARALACVLACAVGLIPVAASAFGFADCPQYVTMMQSCEYSKGVAEANGFETTGCHLKSYSESGNSGIIAYSRKCAACSAFDEIVYGFSCSTYPCVANAMTQERQFTGNVAEGDAFCFKSCKVDYVAPPTGGVASVCVGGSCSSFGRLKATGETCATDEPATPAEPGPCDMSVGICYDRTGPQFCVDAPSGPICTPVHNGDPSGCGNNGSEANCIGNPPPPPPNPPIAHEPPYNPQPPPPDQITNITVNNNTHIDNYYGPSTPPPGPGQGGGDPPNSGRCGTPGNPACPPPTPCGQPGQTCDSSGGGAVGASCGAAGQPVCDGSGNPACGVPGKPACSADGTPSCGVSGRPPCGSDGGPTCGVAGKPQCTGDGQGPACGSPGKPDCVGGNTGACGGLGQPPCASCGGVGQPACSAQCGTPGNPPCSGTCDGAGQPPCDHGTASGGGSCTAPPSCAGDQVGCMTAYQSWRAACATESLADITGADTDYGPTHSASEVMEETTVGGEGGPSLNLDDAGWLGGRSCPQLPNIVVRGASFQFDPQGRLCEFLGIGASLVLLFAYLQAARIIGG